MNQTEPKANHEYYEYDEIDLKDIFKTLGKWKYTIISITLIAMLLSGAVSFFFMEPVYEASTVVAVSQSKKAPEVSGNIEEVVQDMGEMPYLSVQGCETQFKSPAILQSTIETLELPYTRGQLRGRISTEPIKDTSLIRVKVTDTDPKRAATIANTLRDHVVANIHAVSIKQMGQSIHMMENQWLKEEEAELKKASDKLKDYRMQTRSTDFLSAQVFQKTQDLVAFETRLSECEIEREKLNRAIAQDQANIEATPATITTSSAADGILPADWEGMNVKNGKVVRQEVNEAYTESLKAYNEKTSELAGIEAEIIKTRQTINALEEEVAILEAELINNQVEEKKLQNEVQRREKVVDLLSSKITELKATQSINVAENAIITVTSALVPEAPVKPNKKLNVAIAGVLGLMLSVFAVFLIEYLREEESSQE